MGSLLIGLLYASLQLPLDNRENKNSRNVCLNQIRENIFPRKFLLIQYNQVVRRTIPFIFLIQTLSTNVQNIWTHFACIHFWRIRIPSLSPMAKDTTNVTVWEV